MIKNQALSGIIFCLLLLFQSAWASPSSQNEKRIQQFLQEQSKNLSKDCPYRINLMKQGQIDKNSAGIRIAEEAKQFSADNSGLLFYYQLYDHSMRVPHWHANAVEVGTVLSGKMKVVIWEGSGKKKEFTVEKNGTWMIPQASLHALENVGGDKLTFIVAYNSAHAADRDFVTAWAALPSMLLERSLGLTQDEIASVKKSTNNRLSSYDPAAATQKSDVDSSFSSNFSTIAALHTSDLGSIRRVDSTTNNKMLEMALQQSILKPGTLRIPHWYTAGDVLLYVHEGKGFFTMMNDDGKVYNILIKEGDLISLPVGTFHSYLNVDTKDLVIYEAFNTAKNIHEISLLEGAQQFSPGTIAGATGISATSAQKMAQKKPQPYLIAF